MFKYFLLASLYLTLACKNEKKVDNQPQALSQQKIQEKDYSKFIYSFYEWYLSDIYNKHAIMPNYEKKQSGRFGLNIEEYKLNLNKISFLSDSYIKSLVKKCENCNDAMLESAFLEDYNPEYDADFYLGDKENYKCNFLWKDIWLGGQGEAISKIRVDGIVATNSVNQKLVYLTSFIGNTAFSYIEVLILKNSKGELKINDINVGFKKPKINNIKKDIVKLKDSKWLGKYHLTQNKGKIDEFSSAVIGYNIDIKKEGVFFSGQGYQTNFHDLCIAKQDKDTLKLYYNSTLRGTDYNKNEDQPLVKLYKNGSDYYVISPIINNDVVKFTKVVN